MSNRSRFILSVCVIIVVFMIFILFQSYRLYLDTPKRSVSNLMSEYYRLASKSPDGAVRALQLALDIDPNNHEAMRELGFWYLKQGDVKSAVRQLEKTLAVYPDDNKVLYQLKLLADNLNIKTNITTKMEVAHPLYLTYVDWNRPNEIGISKTINRYLLEQTALKQPLDIVTLSGIEQKNLIIPSPDKNANTGTNQPASTSVRDSLLNQFYMNRNTNIELAWNALTRLLLLYPDDIVALKEAGYYALGHHEPERSLVYFKHAYEISHDPYLALQTGYILNSLKQNREAYYYFSLATKANDLSERMKAELALTNLRGAQTRFLPERFFATIMFSPFYRSRFKLLIYPIIARIGYTISEKYHVAAYLSYRRTSDNKSSGSGELPQIFEDNVAITALGIQAAPFEAFPVTGFIEAGKAVDLVYRDRSRWRNDFRMGLVYYGEWGKEARYTFKPSFTLHPNMDLYADTIYFSRYLNTIATMRARPGVEVFRYGSSSLNIYLKAFLSEDRNRIFYNNFIEIGPSIAFTPSDRYFLTIRYECLTGYYLPSGGVDPNPYSTKYHNNMIFLDAFIGF